MKLRGLLYCWVGLMGLGATVAVYLLLRAFPRAFSDSGPAVAWPWRQDASKAARVRAGLLAGAGIASALVAATGFVRLLLAR
jgi:hypothetical protein